MILFPGSFNPFHEGHRYIIKKVLDEFGDHAITLLLCKRDCDSSCVSCDHRLDIIRIGTLGLARICVENCDCSDCDADGIARTILNNSCDDKKICVVNESLYSQLMNSGCDFGETSFVVVTCCDYDDCNCVCVRAQDVKLDVPRDVWCIRSKDIRAPSCSYEILFDKLTDDWLHLGDLDCANKTAQLHVCNDVLDYINARGLYAVDRLRSFNISTKRMAHITSTAGYAKYLAQINGLDDCVAERCFVAAIYHDIAKEIPFDIQVRLVKSIGVPNIDHPNLLHAYLGSNIIRTIYGYADRSVLQAINRHTKPYDYYEDEPDVVAKIVYLADKLEPLRKYKDIDWFNVDSCRLMAEKSFEKCFVSLVADINKMVCG